MKRIASTGQEDLVRNILPLVLLAILVAFGVSKVENVTTPCVATDCLSDAQPAPPALLVRCPTATSRSTRDLC